jgi:hypothetical protein
MPSSKFYKQIAKIRLVPESEQLENGSYENARVSVLGLTRKEMKHLKTNDAQ